MDIRLEQDAVLGVAVTSTGTKWVRPITGNYKLIEYGARVTVVLGDTITVELRGYLSNNTQVVLDSVIIGTEGVGTLYRRRLDLQINKALAQYTKNGVMTQLDAPMTGIGFLVTEAAASGTVSFYLVGADTGEFFAATSGDVFL